MFLASVKNSIAVRVRPESHFWLVLRKAARLLPSRVRATFSIQGILRSFSENVSDVFFMQIGSFDGIQNDPIHDLVMRHQWAGLLVEPVKSSFDRLLNTYQNNDSLRFENVAIAETEGFRQFWRLKETPESIDWHGQLSSFRRDVILNHGNLIPDIENLLISDEVHCTTIESLIHKHGIQRIDLLHLDTEGYDFEILKTFDFKKHRPRVVLYEHAHLSPADKSACSHFLRSKGYKLLEEGTDSIAFL
jgi:FkbM family methyltransferase